MFSVILLLFHTQSPNVSPGVIWSRSGLFALTHTGRGCGEAAAAAASTWGDLGPFSEGGADASYAG